MRRPLNFWVQRSVTFLLETLTLLDILDYAIVSLIAFTGNTLSTELRFVIT